MTDLKLFTDGSVDPQAKMGYGAYLCVEDIAVSVAVLQKHVKTRCFTDTSSTKLELQTLLWALSEIQTRTQTITVYTDSQNTIGLLKRREGFEKNDYLTSKGKLIANHELYKAFYIFVDTLKCSFVKVKGHKKEDDKDLVDKVFTLVDKASREALRV